MRVSVTFACRSLETYDQQLWYMHTSHVLKVNTTLCSISYVYAVLAWSYHIAVEC